MCVNVNLYLYAFRDKSKRIHETRSAPILEGVTAEKYGAPIIFIPYGFILIKQLITRIDIRSAQLVVSINWYKVKFFKCNIPTDHTNTTSRRAIHMKYKYIHKYVPQSPFFNDLDKTGKSSAILFRVFT